MGFIKKRNGSAWEDVAVKKWNNSAWVEPEAKKWNGTQWEVINRQQYVMTFDSEWSHTYSEDNSKRTNSGDKMYQGQYNYMDSPWGLMRSLCGFDEVSIRAELMGAKIDKIELYLRSDHWYYNAGGTAVIGYHNHASEPNTFSHSKYNAQVKKFSARGQAQWIEMPIEFGEGVRDGRYAGFSIFADSTSETYYGSFYGASDGLDKPKMKITYTK